ncbi:MAG: ABC transporter ATP-binding protein/permease [Defluviitaleaceae bacterium]|nr:ABC transporter ATP-binding protein/permease [Defluviitaleaceae bacterium]
MLLEKVNKVLKPLSKFRLFVIFISGLVIIASLFPPLLIRTLIDSLGQDNLHFLVVTILTSLLIYFVLDFLREYLWSNLLARGKGFVRALLFENVLHKEYDYFLTHSLGDISNKILNDSEIYTRHRLILLPTLLLNISHVIIVAIFLAFINIYMMIGAIIFSFAFYGIYKIVNKRLRETAVKEREGYSDMLGAANETLMGINTIQLYSVENYFAKYFERIVEKYETRLITFKMWNALAGSATYAVISLLPIASVLIGILFMPIMNISAGDILAFYTLLPNLSTPLKNLTEFNIERQNARAIEKRLEELLEKKEAENENLNKIEKIETIEFENLGFDHEKGKKAFKNLNIKVELGDALAITGPSGTGKTTMLRMLKRRKNPTEGKILLNGIDALEIDVDSYIERIAVLTQDFFIFDDTISENINLGHNYSEKLIRDRAYTACIDHLSLDENAMGLSGGEKQRVALARALACDFDVLILDEPTSELDYETETKIIKNLKEFQKEHCCILIVVTHSENVIKNLCTKNLKLL